MPVWAEHGRGLANEVTGRIGSHSTDLASGTLLYRLIARPSMRREDLAVPHAVKTCLV